MDSNCRQGQRVPAQKMHFNMGQQRQASIAGHQVSVCNHPSHHKTQQKSSGLGGKDLIIRMLAEVFQVARNEETGQLRWQQMSSSLVPVSLYSRTTGKWLDYLSAASSISSNQKQSAMSPDSRHLLLLLQQFHQQTRATNQAFDTGYDDSTIVFQVVVHDFIDGKCRTILNTNIAQPGTRLGQASDYFVYWRDRDPVNQGSNSIHLQMNYNEQFAQSCCPLGGNFVPEAKTWGLNFASVNDANLFHDICSLNLVDLDFNSDYLKLLALSDRNQPQQQRQIQSNLEDPYQRHKQQFQPPQSNLREQRYSINDEREQHQNSTLRQQSGRQMNDAFQQQQQQQQAHIIHDPRCLVCQESEISRMSQEKIIQQQLQRRQANQAQQTLRIRSRSRSSGSRAHSGQSRNSTHQMMPSSSHHFINQPSRTKLSQSFSTPTTPERMLSAQTNIAPGRQAITKQPPNGSRSKSLSREIPSSAESGEIPRKPLRGVLRDSSTVESLKQATIQADRNRDQLITSQADQQDASTKGASVRSRLSLGEIGEQVASLRGPEDLEDDETRAKMFTSTRMTMRRSTGVDSSNVRQLADSLGSHRPARVARAQYANSKGMKDFLSLDVGNCNQTSDLNGRQDKPLAQNAETNPKEAIKSRIEMVREDTEDNEVQREVATNTDDIAQDSRVFNQMFGRSDNFLAEFLTHDSQKDDLAALSDSGYKRISNIRSDPRVSSKQTRDQSTNTANRRRSLERSSCVDIDIPAQLGYQQRYEQLSQSHPSPMNTNIGPETSAAMLSSRVAGISSKPKRHQPELSPIASSQGGASNFGRQARMRTKSSGESTANYRPIPMSRNVLQNKPLSCRHQRLIAKSTPDVRNVSESYRLQNHPEGYAYNEATIDYNQVVGSQTKPRVTCYVNERDCGDEYGRQQTVGIHNYIRPQLSSYPAPLCWDKQVVWPAEFGRERDPMRQYHSCPNSLRKKRRDVATMKMVHPYGWTHSQWADVDGAPIMNGLGQQQQTAGYCGCQLGGSRLNSHDRKSESMKHGPDDSPYRMGEILLERQHFGDPLELAPQSDRNFQWNRQPQLQRHQQQYYQHQQQQPLQHDQPHELRAHRIEGQLNPVYDLSTTMINEHQCRASRLVDNQASYRRSCKQYNKPLADPVEIEASNHEQAGGQLRPASSLSSRSPLHYGLYESDLDDNEDDGDVDDQSSPTKAENDYIPKQRPNSSCSMGYLVDASVPLDRSRSVYFKQLVEPVEGYDRCLNRQALKARPRAKSQPPSNESAGDAAHLARSMENVRKLIREVQLELDALKRDPLASRGPRRPPMSDRENTTARRPANAKPTSTRTPETQRPQTNRLEYQSQPQVNSSELFELGGTGKRAQSDHERVQSGSCKVSR